MIRTFILTMCLWAITETIAAADADGITEVKNAILKLSDRPNYSWTSTPKTEGPTPNLQPGPTTGVTEKNAYTYFKFSVGQNTVEAAFKGLKSAIKTEMDWESAQELQGERAWIARRLSAFRPPAAEAMDLVGKTPSIKKDKNGFYSADLTPAGVKELLEMRSRDYQTRAPVGAKGWVKFWVLNDVLVRYQFNVQGKVLGANQQEFDVNRTTTVEIKEIGSTKVQIPEEAKKKL